MKKKITGNAEKLTDAQLSGVSGGADRVTIHLYAEVPERVSTRVAADGSFSVTSNTSAGISTVRTGDGVRVNVTAS